MIERLGPYRIVRVLGRGGMGTVYEGIHDETQERAAIKVLSQQYADDDSFRQRFIAEIEVLKELKHPNIVELHGDGEQDGMLFYAMEFVDGQSLQQELQAGHHFEWSEVTKIAVDVCNALKHGHDHGIIHRDLKPANLLRAKDGAIKLADFGIAKHFKTSDLTAAGCIVGTADYMAPEQADGLPVTYRTDLYSLGTVMFTLLARRPPFAGGSVVKVFHKLKYEEAPALRRLAPKVPVELELIVSQLLAKDPDDRLPTALVLANRLKAMEFGLAAGTVVQPIEAIEDPESSVNDEATRVSGVENGLVTEISPTAVDKTSKQEQQQGYSWNDATVVTSGADSDANDGGPARAETVVDRSPSPNRFTTIEEDRKQREKAAGRNWRQHLSTIATGFALLALVAAVYWLLQPNSPEELVRRIRVQADNDSIKEAYGDIKEFLKHYSDHADAPLVRDWESDVHCEFLFSRLDKRKDKLADGEQFFLEGWRSRKSEPEVAREFFEKTKTAKNPGQPNPITSIQAANHQLKRMGSPAPKLTDRAQLPASE